MGIIEHPNLVKLIGYCAEDGERHPYENQRYLVHEFMCNGSVHDHLENRFHKTLSWAQRLRIARQVARGLEYLHEQVEDQIVYRIFKSSIVLLDKEWNAKLSDFVLGRLGPFPLAHPKEWCVGNSEDFLGTKPKHELDSTLTWRDDVWSYGVFILELITGRRHLLNKKGPMSERRLVSWVEPHLSDMNDFQQIMDPRLKGKYSLQSAWKLATVGKLCLTEDEEARPKMSEISTILDKMVEAAEFE
ncbi:hypothetical protein L1049_013036 [Liquidambar formosana]|uniref:Protein kinase domain-containing protein n=1 Tax=Liquidambar formosana TaxID=63359 RepID=A0AAP0RJX0_LIQFO